MSNNKFIDKNYSYQSSILKKFTRAIRSDDITIVALDRHSVGPTAVALREREKKLKKKNLNLNLKIAIFSSFDFF